MANLDIKIKLANSIATVLLLGISQYGVFALTMKNEIEIYGWVYLLYALLHFLLIGMTIYQYLPAAPKDVFDTIGYWYLLIALLNSGIAIFQYFHLNWFGFVGLLWQLATLIFIYHRLRNYPPRNKTDHTLINAPFSILTAITLSDTLHTLFRSFDQTKHSEVAQTILTIILGFVALHLVDYSHRKDWVYASSTAWLLGFASAGTSETTHTVSLVVVGILISAVARTLIPNWLERINRRFGRWSRRLGERTPLLSGH
ncbi:uncharacterized protein BX664DRAFT_325821 [Halteromyces radiatus]|uniref:uncharacterized protein n=1 Tax=Halteromyces radiatus TaxID=101107 RepID=UPI00221ED942|nr:uncharacterized protein BX664DRAFT_325821 [Halteromyces radiatus]KAI8097212.1 hypothetical protein BX664DRAFT_325821 [Halteromyces radiatus]